MNATPTQGPPDEVHASRSLPVEGDPLSAMSPRFNFFFRWFARRFFGHFALEEATVEKLRSLEEQGSVIYVMRYSSRLDYFLFNTLFRRQGLRLSSFANGLYFYYYRPLWESFRIAFMRPRGRSRRVRHTEEQQQARRIAREGGSLFLFLRAARLRSFLRGRSKRPRHEELDLLAEVVKEVWDSGSQVFLVPLSVFWRKGPRSESRFLNLSYGALTRPSDLLKVSSFLATYRSLAVKSGEPIDLSRFISEQRDEGPDQVARKVRRSILVYLYREEKVVEGPTLRTLNRIGDAVLDTPAVRVAIEERARSRKVSIERASAEAEKMFREIAANMNSTFLAALGAIVGWIFRRMFRSIEVDGLERVAQSAREHPIVLVPSHRSYFDFLILSWLFYVNYMVPPHIAARENMAFGPFGFIFRRAGAFFLRRSFDDPLYKEVFRAYVAYLVREGFPQEFFIEGGRSRTGKTMAPRLGMLSWDVEAFLQSSRRELLLVPVSITYERLVEESAMVDELEGGTKQDESLLGLVRARKYLQRRFGTVHLTFDQPISLAAALGDRRRELAGESEEAQAARRQFVERLALEIVGRINWAVVPNATSLAASVLLGSPYRGLSRDLFVTRMRVVLDLLRAQQVKTTAALEADAEEGFRDSIAFLLRADLVKSAEDPEGEILYFEESHRRALDLYRNTVAHYLSVPSILARRLLVGGTDKELLEDLAFWQDLLHQEFFNPRGAWLESRCKLVLSHFEERGWIERSDELVLPTGAGHAMLRFLAEQTRGLLEAYRALFAVAAAMEGEVARKSLLERAQQRFDHDRLLGEAERAESANEATFQNAVDLLVRLAVLSVRSDPADAERRGRRAPGGPLFAPGEESGRLVELRERVARALEQR